METSTNSADFALEWQQVPFLFMMPLATRFYVILYVGVLIFHVLFMNYVLAGTLWTVGAYAIRFVRGGTFSPVSKIVIDWLPAMLSGAITAGIAPLLFVQILYQTEFYTANLLLFHRWMLILPVLIAGFYFLYLLKTRWLEKQIAVVQLFAAIVPFVCIAFTGVSWTENHLLSIRGMEFWQQFYANGTMVYSEPQLLPRLLLWSFGSLPTFACLIEWQLYFKQRRGNVSHTDIESKQLGLLAIGGMIFASFAALAWYYRTSPLERALLGTATIVPYLVSTLIGLITQATSWIVIYQTKRISLVALITCTMGLVTTIASTCVIREAFRWQALGPARLTQLAGQHQKALAIDGFVAFLFFLVVNMGLIALVFWLVQQGLGKSRNLGISTSENEI